MNSDEYTTEVQNVFGSMVNQLDVYRERPRQWASFQRNGENEGGGQTT